MEEGEKEKGKRESASGDRSHRREERDRGRR